jgi:hypothetical protein
MAPFKLAIIGGGPSAFYVASRLLSFLPHSNAQSAPFKIHMYDRLWAPHGLVRYGVAPDHPEVKVRSPGSCQPDQSYYSPPYFRIARTNSTLQRQILAFGSLGTSTLV